VGGSGYRRSITVAVLKPHEPFLVYQSEDGALEDDRFIARNFRLDERLPEARTASYAAEVLSAASDFSSWARRHAEYVEDRIQRPTPPSGPPAALDPDDPHTCPETFASHALAAKTQLVELGLSLVRVVGLYRVAVAVGLDEGAVRAGLDDPALRDAIIERWALKQPIEPVFATMWQDVRDLVPATGKPPSEWADDLRDRLGLSTYDPEQFGDIGVMVLKYKVSDLPTIGSLVTRPVTVPTEIDCDFFPPFCPAPGGSGVGRVVDLGLTLTSPWPEVLHPSFRWRGEHVAQLGVISRSVPSVPAARGRHIKLIQALCGRSDYGTATDGDLL